MEAAGKIIRMALRNTAFSIAAGFVLLLVLNVYVYCPLVDDDSASTASSPGDSSAGLCVPLSRTARDNVAVVLGVLMAAVLFGNPIANHDVEVGGSGGRN